MILNYMHKRDLKRKLYHAFNMGELYLIYSRNVYIYPKILSVSVEKEPQEISFQLPVGMDPQKVEKAFVFEQVFGENIELQRDITKCTLLVYKGSLPSKVKYDYDQIRQHLKGLRLPIVVGHSKHGFEAYDMVPNPNLIISGEPGSGKSTQLRSILTTLILHLSPAQLELYLGDLKRSEFHMFRRVSHVKDVAITTRELSKMLNKVAKELKDRGDLLDTLELTHIDEYNKIAKEKKPYIIVCIDEVALLKNEKTIMEINEEISTIGRALGIYLILSMQRPDADVLDGKLKNNAPGRMAFRHADPYNSWITLGQGNSQAATISIKQKGRMYWKHETIQAVQGIYLEENEAKKLLAPFRGPKEDVKYMGEVEEVKPKEEIKNILGVLEE